MKELGDAMVEALALATEGGGVATVVKVENASKVGYLALVGRVRKTKLVSTPEGDDFIARPVCRVLAP